MKLLQEFLLGKVASLETYRGYADDFIFSLMPETSDEHVSYMMSMYHTRQVAYLHKYN